MINVGKVGENFPTVSKWQMCSRADGRSENWGGGIICPYTWLKTNLPKSGGGQHAPRFRRPCVEVRDDDKVSFEATQTQSKTKNSRGPCWYLNQFEI